MSLSPRLPHQLNAKLTADQWELLEYTADKLDLTMSGAIRHHLDVVLDRPVAGPGSPSRRDLMAEDRGEVKLSDGTTITLESVTRADAPA